MRKRSRFHAERRAAKKRKEDARRIDGNGWLRAANAFNKSLWEDDEFDNRELYDLGLLNVHIGKLPLSMAEEIEITRAALEVDND